MKTPSIVVLGSVNIDLVIRAPLLPAPGETVLGGQFYQSAGGKGANQAVAAARLSREAVALIAAIGNDDFGKQSLDGLRREKIQLDYVKTVADHATGVALIMVDHDGENCICVASGANHAVTPDDVDALPDILFARAKVFLACLESPLDTVARGLERAKAAGLITILNPAPMMRKLASHSMLQNVDILTPNESEAEALCGMNVEQPAAVIQAAESIRALGCPLLVITRGSRGSMVFDENVTDLAATSVKAVDATAAGDAFNGALAVAVAEGRSLAPAARWSTIAAGISVTRRGAQPSLPTREEVDGFPNPPK